MIITKKDVLNRLSEYFSLNKLFHNSFSERISGNWFRNEIIRSLYRDQRALQKFNEILKVVFEKVENIELLKHKLVGTEKQFDDKVLHVYAEILAAKWFVDKGCEYVAFMSTIDGRPSPDIELHSKDKTIHFAEVKYLGLTDDELTPILSQLEELATEHPDIYENKSISIEVQTPFVSKLKKMGEKKSLGRSIDQLIKNFHEKITSEKLICDKKIDANEEYTIMIDKPFYAVFQINKSVHFVAFLFHPTIYGHRITAGTEFFNYGPLYAKLIGRIHSAYLQLLTNRNDDFDAVRNDFIYLYIQQRSTDILYYEKIKNKVNLMLDALGVEEVVQLITNDENVLKVNRQICPVFSRCGD